MGEHQFADPREILRVLQSRLIGTLRGANSQNVVVVEDPQSSPVGVLPGRYCWTLTWGAGQFDSAAWDGAGRETLITDAEIVVGIQDSQSLDMPYRDEIAMQAVNNGMLWKMNEVLGSLAGFNAPDPTAPQYDILAEPLKPLNHSKPRRGEGDWMESEVSFIAKFCWLLGELPR